MTVNTSRLNIAHLGGESLRPDQPARNGEKKIVGNPQPEYHVSIPDKQVDPIQTVYLQLSAWFSNQKFVDKLECSLACHWHLDPVDVSSTK